MQLILMTSIFINCTLAKRAHFEKSQFSCSRSTQFHLLDFLSQPHGEYLSHLQLSQWYEGFTPPRAPALNALSPLGPALCDARFLGSTSTDIAMFTPYLATKCTSFLSASSTKDLVSIPALA